MGLWVVLSKLVWLWGLLVVVINFVFVLCCLVLWLGFGLGRLEGSVLNGFGFVVFELLRVIGCCVDFR